MQFYTTFNSASQSQPYSQTLNFVQIKLIYSLLQTISNIFCEFDQSTLLFIDIKFFEAND